MSGHEQADHGSGPEAQAVIFVDIYRAVLKGTAESCLHGADVIVDEHQRGLGNLLDRDEAWTEPELLMTLNNTSSSIGKLLSGAYSEIDGFLEKNHHAALDKIPEEDRWIWELIQGQRGRTGLGSDEVEALYGSASGQEAADVMKIASDYPLWLFVQQQAAASRYGPELKAYMDTASDPVVSDAMGVGIDFPLWRRITAQASRRGPDYPHPVSPEYASDERIQHAMEAGLIIL